jgi:hypothetical protein
MDFEVTPEQESVQKAAIEFARQELNSNMIERDGQQVLYVSESFVKSCLDAIQVHGGRGFLTELELESEMRDSVGSTPYSGTSEIQRNIIGRGLQI